jgi:hypothetical protein
VNFTAEQIRTGRRWAYTVMLAMLGLSIAGNISHTLHVNPDPSIRSLVYAVSWPVMVWAGVELFVRIPWQALLTHRLIRWVGILLVSSIAALVSYNHLSGLLEADKEDWVVYSIGPLAIDGLMLMATLGLLLTRPLVSKAEELPAPATAHLEVSLTQANETITRLLADVEDANQELAAALERDGKPEPYKLAQSADSQMLLADLLPVPVSPATQAMPMTTYGPVLPLAGWEAPSASPAKTRTRATAWDEELARKLLLEGKSKADVAEAVGVAPKTIQRLRARMVAAGELKA